MEDAFNALEDLFSVLEFNLTDSDILFKGVYPPNVRLGFKAKFHAPIAVQYSETNINQLEDIESEFPISPHSAVRAGRL
jgi:hypothetical protein